MKPSDTTMPTSVPVMTRVSPALKKKLQTLAKDTRRSESFLVAEAITDYVELNAWQVRTIKQRLDEALAVLDGARKWPDAV